MLCPVRWIVVFGALLFATPAGTYGQTLGEGGPHQRRAIVLTDIKVRIDDSNAGRPFLKITGSLDLPVHPLPSVIGMTFSLYEKEDGGSPLFIETQNVEVELSGKFSVLLGSTQTEGVPKDLLLTGSARWIGILVQLPREIERARIPIDSVPYAMKANDAETLGGQPASSFLSLGDLKPGGKGLILWPGWPGSNTAQNFRATSNVGPSFISQATIGPPLEVRSTSLVPFLNADLLDGVDSTEFQRLVNGACPNGSSIRLIRWDGTVDCTTAATGILLLHTGPGLLGGPITSAGSVSLDTAFTDSRYLLSSGGTISGGLSGSSANFSGRLSSNGFQLMPLSNADQLQGGNSSPLDVTSSVFDSSANSPRPHIFRWQAEPVNNNSPAPSARLSLVAGLNTPIPTGLSINGDGTINFAPGQAFPTATGLGSGGDITGVTVTTGLSGGGSVGDVAVGLDIPFTDGRYAQLNGNNTFTGSVVFDGGIEANRLNDVVYVGTDTDFVPDPMLAPLISVEVTSGGSIDSTPRYYRYTLVNWNGETRPSPVTVFSPSSCVSGGCKILVQMPPAAHEWRYGAIGWRIYVSFDNSTFYRQTGFPGELDTAGNVANVHMPGNIILSTLTFAGSNPPTANTALIDADQKALNEACNPAPHCYGTVQYRGNPVGGYAQTGTTPLIVAFPAVIRGLAASGADNITSGSTRVCGFRHSKLGCVMVVHTNAASIQNLHVMSGSHGYMLYKSNGLYGVAGNNIEIGNATVRIVGSQPGAAALFIQGVFYYLRFPNLQLWVNNLAAGCAGVLIANAAGADWAFTGPVRWTISDPCDPIRNNKGKTDPDRNSQDVPTVVGKFGLRDIIFQMGTSGFGTGTIKAENLVVNWDRVSWSDWNPAPGVGPLLQLGFDADGAGVCCTQMYIRDSVFFGHANAPSTIKVTGTAEKFKLTLDGNQIPGSNIGAAVSLDMSNIPIQVFSYGGSFMTCNIGATRHAVINVAPNAVLHCIGHASDGRPETRVANTRLAGSTALVSDSDSSKQRNFYWSGSDTLDFVTGADPLNPANKVVSYGSGKDTCWMNDTGTGCLFRTDARSGVNRLIAGGPFLPLLSGTSLGSVSNRWQGYFSNIDVSNSAEITNLNSQFWHGKQAIDVSAPLDFPPIQPGSCLALSVTAAGAPSGSPVAPGWPASLEASLTGIMLVASQDNLSIRLCNITTVVVDPAAATFTARINR